LGNEVEIAQQKYQDLQEEMKQLEVVSSDCIYNATKFREQAEDAKKKIQDAEEFIELMKRRHGEDI